MDVKYLELDFEQTINFERDRTILAVAREQDSGRLRLFRIDDSTGAVSLYFQDSWRSIAEPESGEVLNRLVRAWHKQIPVYTVN